MSEFANTLARIAVLPNVLRVRSQDAIRREVNGGENGELEAKVAAAAKQLKKVLDSLEEAVA